MGLPHDEPTERNLTTHLPTLISRMETELAGLKKEWANQPKVDIPTICAYAVKTSGVAKCVDRADEILKTSSIGQLGSGKGPFDLPVPQKVRESLFRSDAPHFGSTSVELNLPEIMAIRSKLYKTSKYQLEAQKPFLAQFEAAIQKHMSENEGDWTNPEIETKEKATLINVDLKGPDGTAQILLRGTSFVILADNSACKSEPELNAFHEALEELKLLLSEYKHPGLARFLDGKIGTYTLQHGPESSAGKRLA